MTAGDKLLEMIALKAQGHLLLNQDNLEDAKRALDGATDQLESSFGTLRRELVADREEVIRRLVAKNLAAGQAAENSGEPEKARQCYEVGQSLTTGTPHEYEFRVRLARLDGIDPDAIDVPLEELARRVEASPESPEALYDFATQLALDGHLDEAIVRLRRLTILTPDDPEVYFRLGNALADTAQFADALRTYDKAQALGFEDKAEIEFQRGEVSRLGSGDLREAQRHYEAALTANSVHLESMWGLAHVAEEQARFETALSYLDKAKAVDPEDPGLHLHAGELYLKLNLVEKARAAWNRTIELDPEGAEGETAREYIEQLDEDEAQRPGTGA